MELISRLTGWAESVPLPDAVTRAAIAALVARTDKRLRAQPDDADTAFAERMAGYPIAMHVEAANEQHYEVPAEFFALILGPHRKYSCCFYDDAASTLAAAEERALSITMDRADLRDGQSILELGCGWGSLSLAMAGRFPAARIVAVSNSSSQRAYIEGEARSRGLDNLTVVTADMNAFAPEGRFDRIVSVEMFEHMANWQKLLERAREWLADDGRLFLHVFTHLTASYRFETAYKADWIAQHFFTGGIMPSQRLIHRFPDVFAVEEEWRWSGEHYRRTADDWLANFDRNIAAIDPILAAVYGRHAALWRRRWRMFFMATSGLFGHRSGESWGVGHYRLRPS